MDTKKQMNVRAIENGTVIDHIPADCLFKIINMLDLEKETGQVTFGTNFESKRMGKKAIIKIADRYCADEEVNRISIVAPMACVNTIRNYQVVEKRTVKAPEEVEGFVKCGNPRCITNHERIRTRFEVQRQGNAITGLRCHFCEKVTTPENIVIVK